MFGLFERHNSTTTLAEVLRGSATGRTQSVGNMQVIPLLSDLVDDRFLSPMEGGAAISTPSYGTMVFDNPSRAILLVPCHAGYVVKKRAQDHAMATTGLVPRRRKRGFDNAMCVQSSQGGYIKSGQYRMIVLPFPLREKALAVRHRKDYQKLWSSLAEFNEAMGVTRRGSHLEFFLEQYSKQLDQFVAEFECVPRQVGAIVLVDGQVVGIERAPSHEYWASVWPSLIRECYGSLAIQVARRSPETPPRTRLPLSEYVASLDELGEAVAQLAEGEEERSRATVRGLLDETFELQVEDRLEGLTIATLTDGRDGSRFVGQLVRDGERVVYASVLVTARHLEDERWRAATPLRI